MRLRDAARRTVWVVAAVATVALAAVGCAGQGSPDTAPQTNADTAATLGPVNKATGAPVTIGFLTDGRSASIDFTSAQQTAHAAVKYINEHLGGVAGHPIKLFICETQQLPSKARDCGSRMVDKEVPVVLNDVTGVGGAAVPPILHAGIPYMSFSAASEPELTGEGAFSVTGSIASSLGGFALAAKSQGITKIAVMAMDIPAVTQGLHTLVVPAFENAGVEVKTIPVPPGTPDLTPQVQSAISSDAGGILMFGDKTICSAGLQSARTLGYSGKLYVVNQCIDPNSVKSIPGGYSGVTTSTPVKLQDGDAEYELYKAVLDHYSPDTAEANKRSGTAVEGYGVVLGFARAMASMDRGKLTPDTVTSTLSNSEGATLPVGGGATFSCAHDAIPALPSICSTSTWIAKLGADGQPTSYKEVDPAPLFR